MMQGANASSDSAIERNATGILENNIHPDALHALKKTSLTVVRLVALALGGCLQDDVAKAGTFTSGRPWEARNRDTPPSA